MFYLVKVKYYEMVIDTQKPHRSNMRIIILYINCITGYCVFNEANFQTISTFFAK